MPRSTRPSNQRAAQMWIRELVLQGRSGASIIRTLRGAGLGYRDTVVRADIRAWRGAAVQAEQFRGLDPQGFLPAEQVLRDPVKSLLLRDLFRADFISQGVESATGKRGSRRLSLSFDHAMSPNQMLAAMAERAAEFAPESGWDVEQLTLTNVFGQFGAVWE